MFKDILADALALKTKALRLTKKHQTPFYLYDKQALKKSAQKFRHDFLSHMPDSLAFYAIKSNPYQNLLEDVAKEKNFGLDASSLKELKSALATRAKKILLTGPAKTKEELILAIKNANRVHVQIDSRQELVSLDALTKRHKKKIDVGVRIYTPSHGSWNKFGIPLSDLTLVFRDIKKSKYLTFRGIQSHSSFNQRPDRYVRIIREVARYLQANKNTGILQGISFIDLGGGFIPHKQEGDYIGAGRGKIPTSYKYEKTTALVDYRNAIRGAIKKHLSPILTCSYYFEPGRIISQNSMHLVMSVADIKPKNAVILNAGNNMTGWEKYEQTYVPMINLSSPSKRELHGVYYGNLCTPSDIWGFFCYAKKISVGDTIIIPYQGAYTYTYRQEFIKGVPPVLNLE